MEEECEPLVEGRPGGPETCIPVVRTQGCAGERRGEGGERSGKERCMIEGEELNGGLNLLMVNGMETGSKQEKGEEPYGIQRLVQIRENGLKETNQLVNHFSFGGDWIGEGSVPGIR